MRSDQGHPQELADDRQFENLTQLLARQRSLQAPGHADRGRAGAVDHGHAATDREKFDAWAGDRAARRCGNPLFHWTALELKRYFEIAELLSPDSASRVWATGNERLRAADYTARGLIARANVECVCTSDRLPDDLQAHARLAESGFATRVLPSLRVDEDAS